MQIASSRTWTQVTMSISYDDNHYTIYIYIYIYKVNCPTVVEGNPKAPFSIAIKSGCRGGCYSFLWVAPLTLDFYFIMLIVKWGGIKYNFCEFGITQSGLNPGSPRPLENTLPMDQSYIYIYIYIHTYRVPVTIKDMKFQYIMRNIFCGEKINRVKQLVVDQEQQIMK